jgi:hypothetical protein
MDIDGAIDRALVQLAIEIEEVKRSYFSEQGKPGANWQPLKPNTIKYKKANKNKFNTETGLLRDSIKIDVRRYGDSIYINCEMEHREGDEAIDQLIYEYGRDFLNFDDKDQEWITSRLGELIGKELSGSTAVP